MNQSTASYLARWKWWILPATAMVLLSLIPQIHFWLVRGRDWNGAYATVQGDEFLYSAYINALTDGRSRRNDPFAGRDSTPMAPLPESTFSIQFIPAYAISLSARVFRASASTAFVALSAATALLASLSLFWLLASVTGDRKLAVVGVLLVLCCGELAGDQGIVGVLLLGHQRSVFMPFLRRYQPAAAFPLFFGFFVLVWRSLTVEVSRRARLYSTLAGLTLAVLIFSYLYLWTAAAAWLACLALLWLYLRPAAERRRNFQPFAITAAIATVALLPYAYLVSRRGRSLDDVQILMLTHRPDLFHTPELISAFILVALILSVRSGRFKQHEPRVIFAASLALLPFLLFNQQVLTGRSMQPFHFDLFVANYAVLVSLLIVGALLWQPVPKRLLLWIGLLCFSWGAVEVSLLALARTKADVASDQTIPVLLRLKELSKQDGTLEGLRDRGKVSALVFSPHVEVMQLLPTWTPQGTLLGAGALDFGSAPSHRARKDLLYIYLYYCGANGERLREYLNEKSHDSYMDFYANSVIFGDERIIPQLSLHPKPIQKDEIEQEVGVYQAYVDSFSIERVLEHPVTYVITKGEAEPDLSRIDRWYERDVGERVGAYTLYRLKLRE